MGIKKSFVLTSIYRIIYVLTPLLTTPYISRVLGASNIGVYSYSYSIAYYFTLFIQLGVLTYGNRAIATLREDKKKMSEAFCEIFTLQFAGGVIFSVLYIFWSLCFAPDIHISLLLFFFVFSSVVDITWLLYGVGDFTVTALRDICVRVLTVLCVFVFVKTSEDLWIYTLIQSVGYCLGQLLAWLRIKAHIEYIHPAKNQVLKHLKPDMVLFIPTIAVSIYKTMDKIMLGKMSGSLELGFYESSERVINLPMALIIAFATVMLPHMSNLMANDASEDKVRGIIDKSLMLTTFISTLMCFGMMSVANQFVPLFYGTGYEKCITLYFWILPSCVFLAFANVLRTQYLLPKKRDKQYIISLFIGAGINLLLNLILIPRYASVGAAIATFIAEISVCVVQMGFTWHEIGILTEIVHVFPFIIAGSVMFLLFGRQVIDLGNEIFSLLVKTVECGMTYLLVIGIIFGGYMIIKNRIDCEKRA